MYNIINGDALSVLQSLESESINCCITSPPYYGLRDYGIGGQIGLEKTLSEYIEKLVSVFREVWRILKNDGTLWLNIGDSYACKNIMGVPWRLAFALQSDGWFLRQDIIWHKPNCMPESVKDRCTKSHEYIFLLSKSGKYYFDNDAIKEPAITTDRTAPRGSKGAKTPNSGRRKHNTSTHKIVDENLPLLRNKRDVWSVSTCGYKEAHFATFPEKLIEPCVLAGCPECGVILDPFIGSGTTAVVAVKNNRNCVGIEINPDYANIALQRIKEMGRAVMIR